MWKKPRSCRPQDMIYPDRCMLKWQGMLLSDHNERMKLDVLMETCEKPARYHTEAEYEAWDCLIQRSLWERRRIRLVVSRPNEPEFTVSGMIRSIRQGKLDLWTETGSLVLLRSEIDGVEDLQP